MPLLPLKTMLLALRLRLHRPQLATTWQLAVALAGRASYEEASLTEFRVARMLLNRQRNRQAPLSAATEQALQWLQRLDGIASAHVVDFGGADGAFLRALQARCPDVRGSVVESEALVERLPEVLRQGLSFCAALPDDFDVFYSACALNYVAEPMALLELGFQRARQAVVLQRNCFSNQEQFRVQLSSLHANGWGELPDQWPDRLVSYPHRTLVPNQILQLAHAHGFVLDAMFGNTSGVIGRAGSGQFGVDLLFVRQRC